jgi:cell division protein FtsN
MKPSAASAVAGASARKATGGAYGVQLGAFKSGAAAAHRRWAALQTKYPDLLAGLEPRVTAANSATGNLHRLQVLHLSKTRARSICRVLKAKAQACVLVLPVHAS